MPRLLSKRIVFDVKKVLMLYSENIQYAIMVEDRQVIEDTRRDKTGRTNRTDKTDIKTRLSR